MIPSRNQKLKNAFNDLITAQQPTLFITLAINQIWKPDRLKSLVRDYLARIDNAFLGSKWSKKPAAESMNGVFMIEHVGGNIHVHGLVEAPCCNSFGLQLQSEDIWKCLCPSGTVVVKPVTDEFGVANYDLKEAYKDHFFEEQIFFASEFMRGLSIRSIACPPDATRWSK